MTLRQRIGFILNRLSFWIDPPDVYEFPEVTEVKLDHWMLNSLKPRQTSLVFQPGHIIVCYGNRNYAKNLRAKMGYPALEQPRSDGGNG